MDLERSRLHRATMFLKILYIKVCEHRLCACTRAIAEGEDIRAGRWWWESTIDVVLHQVVL
jgi:hypothetical protein